MAVVLLVGGAVTLGSGFVTAVLLIRLGLPRRGAVGAGVGVGIAEAVLLVALLVVTFNECLAENVQPAPPLSWSWSPRREFCDAGTPAQLGSLALLLVPSVLIGGGAWLRDRQRPTVAAGVWALVLALPFLPSLYVGALPYYELYSYPVLHQPLLRTANQGGPPRVCYVYGIAHGPHAIDVNPTTERICVELAETSEALRLTPTYDQGRTLWELDLMGKKLTEQGLPVEPGPTGVDGLEIERVYELPDSQAREESTLIPT